MVKTEVLKCQDLPKFQLGGGVFSGGVFSGGQN